MTDRNMTLSRLALGLVLGLALAGCGEEDPLGGGGGTPGGGGNPIVTVRMGNGFGASFTNQQIGVTSGNLSAGGSTELSVTFVDQDEVLFDDEQISVSFASTCIAQGLATVTTPVTTTTGLATTTYTARGCSGTDVVTATATANEQSLSATGSITIAPAVIGSIAFVSATPSNIGLRGTGGTGRSETSVVVFQVLDSGGAPMLNQTVNFALNTTVGGMSLAPASATTDSSGLVQTIVQAGTVATSVRVTASTTQGATTIQTQSDQLTVTTGVPDQDSFTISADILNSESWSINGVVVVISTQLSDRFNNPVPDGTAVTFTTEGGSIVGNCVTVAGACSVNWTSSQPRPTDGRVTVLATAIGEESFLDLNGNGVFDDGDTFAGQDLGEAFRDEDEDTAYDAATEPFLDFNSNSSRDAADGLWNGLLCDHSTLCGAATSVNVRGSVVLVMSGSDAFLVNPPTITGPGTYTYNITDLNGNPMPQGTTVDFELDDGDTQGPTGYTVGNTNAAGGTFHSITIVPDSTPTGGLLTITISTPGGVATLYTFAVPGV